MDQRVSLTRNCQMCTEYVNPRKPRCDAQIMEQAAEPHAPSAARVYASAVQRHPIQQLQVQYSIRPPPSGNDTSISFPLSALRFLSAFITTSLPPSFATMSFEHSSALESQPTNFRRQDDPEYADDPEFNRFTTQLSDKLFSLTSNISRLQGQVALLGTKRETDRVRERVQDLIEETSNGFKDVGEGLKRVQAWPDLGVCPRPSSSQVPLIDLDLLTSCNTFSPPKSTLKAN